MARDTTPRGVPFYAGGDRPAGMDQQKDLAVWIDSNVAKVHQGGTESRPATREPKKLFWDSTTKELLYDDGTSLETAMPRTAAGDLAGTWPQPTLARVSSDNLPLHTDGARRLIRETRNLPASATGVVELGSLIHQGVTVSVTLAYLATGVQRIARYELAVVPASDTGWRSVAQAAAAGSGSAAVRIEAREVDGVLFLRVREAAAGTGRSVVATIDVEGRSSSWTPATGTSEPTVATNTWTAGGPINPTGLLPIGGVLDWPATTAPSGPAEWLELAGQNISKSSWPELFAAWGITGQTMNLPDRRGRGPIGAGAGGPGLSPRYVGGIGGVETHPLTAAQSGTNGNGTTQAGGGFWGAVGGQMQAGFANRTYENAGYYAAQAFGMPDTMHSHGLNARNADEPHPNMQPFIVTRYFVRAR